MTLGPNFGVTDNVDPFNGEYLSLPVSVIVCRVFILKFTLSSHGLVALKNMFMV